MLDEAGDLVIAHHPLFVAARRTGQLMLLLQAPAVNTVKRRGLQHHPAVDTLVQWQELTPQGIIDVFPPEGVRVLIGFQRVDRSQQLGRGLRPDAQAPALQQHNINTAFDPVPVRRRAAVVPGLVKARHTHGSPAAGCQQGIQGVVQQRHIVGARHATGGKQRMHRCGQFPAGGAGEVEVIQGERNRAQTMLGLQQGAQVGAKGGLARPLAAIDPCKRGPLCNRWLRALRTTMVQCQRFCQWREPASCILQVGERQLVLHQKRFLPNRRAFR